MSARKVEIDYLILGQGISGTLLSYNLLRAGKKVMVIDAIRAHSASRVTSGIINPVTGQRMVKAADYETQLAVALNTYSDLGKRFDTTFIYHIPIINFHASHKSNGLFQERAINEPNYLHEAGEQELLTRSFKYEFGAGVIDPCWQTDVASLLALWRQSLIADGLLLEDPFDWKACAINTHNITYKGITAKKLICCEGMTGSSNPYFSYLPFNPNKGEIIIASIPGLSRSSIYKQNIAIVPWKDDLFWIGASNEWKFEDLLPSPAFRHHVVHTLDKWVKLPYTIVDHWASQRPTTIDHHSFIGVHPKQPEICIFNGFGSKGCLTTPYYAHQFTAHLLHGTPLDKTVDIKRYS